MSYNLYLDDLRNPRTQNDWVIIRTYTDAINYVNEHGLPSYMSLDHDLGIDTNGIEQTGYDFVKWLVQYVIDNDLQEQFQTRLTWNVHSANSVGTQNISKYLDGFLDFLTNHEW